MNFKSVRRRGYNTYAEWKEVESEKRHLDSNYWGEG
jgi:hypothetical protein